ncbi:MAG: hypothetical protein GF375_04470 [Candidatus Omnitrophica bacterium]|nr:hypothetical protein [Candidatus Omnitrophota bacterium]MBD3269284.1 hypothetical protein [Candidatus Omnitrophota bacterium]
MKRGVVMVVVIGILMIIFILIAGALALMNQETYTAEHKIGRMRAFYAAQAGMARSFEDLMSNPQVDPSGNPAFTVGSTIVGYSSTGMPVRITYTDDNSGPGGTDPLTITVDYEP